VINIIYFIIIILTLVSGVKAVVRRRNLKAFFSGQDRSLGQRAENIVGEMSLVSMWAPPSAATVVVHRPDARDAYRHRALNARSDTSTRTLPPVSLYLLSRDSETLVYPVDCELDSPPRLGT